MKDDLIKVYEMMRALNPEFKLTEDSFTSFNNQQQPEQSHNIKSGNVKAYGNAQQSAKSVNSRSQKIKNAIEFPDAFRIWFTSLGYTPKNNSINIARVTSEIKKVMLQLGYK